MLIGGDRLTHLQKKIIDCLSDGMSTKEIKEKLNCSESSIKKIRTDKKLRQQYTNSYQSTILSIIPSAIDELEKIIKNPTVKTDEKIAASRQLIELVKLREEIAPQEDIEIKVTYV